jgi:hypothetical protein
MGAGAIIDARCKIAPMVRTWSPQDCGNDIPSVIYVGYIPQVADGVDVSRNSDSRSD